MMNEYLKSKYHEILEDYRERIMKDLNGLRNLVGIELMTKLGDEKVLSPPNKKIEKYITIFRNTVTGREALIPEITVAYIQERLDTTPKTAKFLMDHVKRGLGHTLDCLDHMPDEFISGDIADIVAIRELITTLPNHVVEKLKVAIKMDEDRETRLVEINEKINYHIVSESWKERERSLDNRAERREWKMKIRNEGY
ncbi:MAG: hypothetical protein KAS32_06035 [Candidatus Peribacteraceae bacterium]|nr:hypothetical protein [Candidatus Peribacteraceae bacterium]